MDDYIQLQTQLKECLEEGYTYWVFEGAIYRDNRAYPDPEVKILGPGGWTEIL